MPKAVNFKSMSSCKVNAIFARLTALFAFYSLFILLSALLFCEDGMQSLSTSLALDTNILIKIIS